MYSLCMGLWPYFQHRRPILRRRPKSSSDLAHSFNDDFEHPQRRPAIPKAYCRCINIYMKSQCSINFYIVGWNEMDGKRKQGNGCWHFDTYRAAKQSRGLLSIQLRRCSNYSFIPTTSDECNYGFILRYQRVIARNFAMHKFILEMKVASLNIDNIEENFISANDQN